MTNGSSRDVNSKKTVAGICGILVGALGVHKFILGYTTEGIIMIAISFLTCGVGAPVMSIIGICDEYHRHY